MDVVRWRVSPMVSFTNLFANPSASYLFCLAWKNRFGFNGVNQLKTPGEGKLVLTTRLRWGAF